MGNIILVKNFDILSKLIRWYTKSEFNHVGIIVDNKYIVEAIPKYGVRLFTLQNYKNQKEAGELDFIICKVKNLSESERKIVETFALKQVGKSYDFVQLICVGILYMFRKLRKLEPIDLNGWLCSELVAESFYEVGIKFKKDVDPDNITPKDIYTSEVIE